MGNTLRIPDNCFNKYGLNESKTVVLFRVKPFTERDGVELEFFIPNSTGNFSEGVHTKDWDCRMQEKHYYFYDKRDECITHVNTQENFNRTAENYGIQAKWKSN